MDDSKGRGQLRSGQVFAIMDRMQANEAREAIFVTDGYELENNDWGAKGVEHKQIAYTRQSDGTPENVLCGVHCIYPDIGEQNDGNQVFGYPELIYGQKPWAGHSTCKELPIALERFDPRKYPTVCNVEYSLQWLAKAGTRHNIAFDCWVTKGTPHSKDQIATEVMVWLYAFGGATPAGEKVDSFTDESGRGWDTYVARVGDGWWDRPWNYIAYLAHEPIPAGVVSISSLLLRAIQHGHIDPAHFLSSISLGPEMSAGELALLWESYSVYIA